MISNLGAALQDRYTIEREIGRGGMAITDSSHPNRDVAPDGNFLLLKRAGAESQPIVVHNWGREFREKTAPRR